MRYESLAAVRLLGAKLTGRSIEMIAGLIVGIVGTIIWLTIAGLINMIKG